MADPKHIKEIIQEMFTVERWHKIEGFEDYQVSNLGRARSFKNGKVSILKPKGRRYLQITVYGKEGKDQPLLHRLVAFYFVPNPLNLPEVNHKDLDKTNCAASNLEWCNKRENVSHFNNTKDRSSKYTGVHLIKKTRKFMARIETKGKRIYLGVYDTEAEAHQAYVLALKELNLTNKYLSK